MRRDGYNDGMGLSFNMSTRAAPQPAELEETNSDNAVTYGNPMAMAAALSKPRQMQG